MKHWFLVTINLFLMQSVNAEFVDPMRPPDFALEKLRLENIKKNPVVSTATQTSKKKKEAWVLNSVLYSKARQYAIVNGQLVKKSDRVDGAKVLTVSSDSVRLSYKGKIIKLKINDLNSRGLASGSDFKMIKKSLNEKKL